MPFTKYIYLFISIGVFVCGAFLYMFLPSEHTEKGTLWVTHKKEGVFYIRGFIDNLKINSWSNSKVKIDYTKKISSNSKVRAEKKMKNLIFDTYNLQNSTVFNPVTLPVSKNSGVINQLNLFGDTPHLKLEVWIPENSKFNVGLSKGSINLENINCESRLSTSSGDINLTNVKGFHNVKTYHGNITGSYLSGQYRIYSAKGDINIRHIKGMVSANAPSGNIDVKHYDKIFAQK